MCIINLLNSQSKWNAQTERIIINFISYFKLYYFKPTYILIKLFWFFSTFEFWCFAIPYAYEFITNKQYKLLHQVFHTKIERGIPAELEKCQIENSKLINKFRIYFLQMFVFLENWCFQTFSLNNTSINIQFNLVIKSYRLQITKRFYMQNYKCQIWN